MPLFTPFVRAVQVWPAALSGQMNIWLSFHARVKLPSKKTAMLRIAAASTYRVWLGGEFLGEGPARTAHGFARVDEWPVAANAKGELALTIEIADYGVPTFCETHEPGYCCAELVAGKKLLAWTAPKGGGFVVERRGERAHQVERYSYQRAFVEGYTLDARGLFWQSADYNPTAPLALARVKHKRQWLERGMAYPDFSVIAPKSKVVRGTSRFDEAQAAKIVQRRFLFDVPGTSLGWPLDQVEWPLFRTLAGLVSTTTGAAKSTGAVMLAKNNWLRVDFGGVKTGFPQLRVKANEATRLLLIFDELLMDGQISFDRADCVNSLWLHLAAGTQVDFQSFEPYTFQHLQVLVVEGRAVVEKIRLRNCINAEKVKAAPKNLTPAAAMVRGAALASFRQNALDVFMDCPSRERAGWLCDSLFTARAEWHFCGDNPIERAFLENFLRPKMFAGLPAGMVPMCYPAEPLACFGPEPGVPTYIPNWAMFLVLQLDEVTRERRLPKASQPLVERRVRGLIKFFEHFENESGLLEKLKSWVFVEWSKSNEFVQDVNFPTNMLYVAMLRASAGLLGDRKLAAKAQRLENTIRALAWKDGRFVDNAVRDQDGRLVVTEHASEVCQYYAFSFGLATPEREGALWRRLVKEDYREFYPANAFVGKLLRLELLIEHGEFAAARRELMKNFAPMARQTGTLWEHTDIRASCNHGFTSYIAVLIDRLAKAGRT